MAGAAGVPGFYDPRRSQNPGVGKATLSADPVVPLTVTLPPGSSLATKYAELNKNYNDAKAQLTAAQASGDAAAINKANTNLYFHQTQLNNFVKGQNDTTRSTLDEKNIVDPNKANANVTTTTATANRDDRAPSVTPNSTVQTAQASSIILKPNQNLLHGYSSYTYKWTLGVLSELDYNTLINDPTRTVDLKHLLIASGGLAQDKRAAYFKEDFYFDSVDLELVFGATGNTNGGQITFKIIEPYGASLIERMVKALSELVRSDNYIDQPYLLTLDFWGYDDEALAPKKIEGCTRNFIIGIAGVEFSVTNKGSEYEFKAIPYAQTCLKESVATIDSNFEVSAKTVREFFGDAKDTAQAPAGNKGTTGRDDRASTPADPVALFGSLSYVLSQSQKEKQKQGAIDIADEFVFKIDKEIADAAILAPDDKSIKDVPMKTELYKKYSAAASNKKIQYDGDKRKIAVAGGTTIINLINDVVLHSTYTLNQIIDADSKEAETLKAQKPISWLRIITDIELLGFDKKRNRYAKRYIFTLLKFSVFGHFHEQMGQAPVPGVSKIYDYFYTGQNKDIIDLKIEYKADSLNYLNSNRSFKAGSTPTTNIDKNPDTTDNSNPPANAFPGKFEVSNTPALNSASRASTNSNDLIINDVKQSLLTSYGAGADMVEVKIDIVGDPAFIIQSDIFYGKHTGQFANSSILPDGSLNPCVTDIYVLLRFNTPNDIDLEKGIYDFTDKGDKEITSSSFTGLYKTVTVLCNFSDGKFTQNLTLLRERNQSSNYVIESAAKNRFVNTDSSPEAIKKLESQASKVLTGVASELSNLASIFAPIKNLLNGRL